MQLRVRAQPCPTKFRKKYADVERSAGLAGEDVGPGAAHGAAHIEVCGVCGAMGPRDKPEDDIVAMSPPRT